ncbi:MAG: hypothetical protein MK085_09190 [Phycisphaerales bacterium]|nr:hypothetical protein [Phycisphaerales bacterium]
MSSLKILYSCALACLVVGLATATGCRGEEQASPAPIARDGYEIPIPSREYWKNSNTLKFEYEMRYDLDGKLKRNGWSRAYYGSGRIEREGAYTNNERVGIWTLYEPDGTSRIEDRGGIVIWSAAGQVLAMPGTEP